MSRMTLPADAAALPLPPPPLLLLVLAEQGGKEPPKAARMTAGHSAGSFPKEEAPTHER